MKKTKNEVYFNPKLGYIWTYMGFKNEIGSRIIEIRSVCPRN